MLPSVFIFCCSPPYFYYGDQLPISVSPLHTCRLSSQSRMALRTLHTAERHHGHPTFQKVPCSLQPVSPVNTTQHCTPPTPRPFTHRSYTAEHQNHLHYSLVTAPLGLFMQSAARQSIAEATRSSESHHERCALVTATPTQS